MTLAAQPHSVHEPSAVRAQPELSVVIPSVNGWGDLSGCLRAVEAQRAQLHLETVVVDRLGGELPAQVRRDFPDVRVVSVPLATNIPQMRAAGIAHATAPAVAMIEDHVVVPEGWARALLGALDAGADVAAGAITNAACDTVLDWAAFLCEYSACLPPLPAGSSTWLPGNNTIYRRDLLKRHQHLLQAGLWENHLHDALRAGGTELICRPEIVVGHKKHYTAREYLSQRYLYARSYAGARVAGGSKLRRFTMGLAACALPPVLFYRTVVRILPKRPYRRRLWLSLPWISLFVLSWSWGEAVGAWFGAGDSLERVC